MPNQRLAFAAVLALHASWTAIADEEPKKPLIVVSKETTLFTSPIRSDGYVDYLKAVDEAYGREARADENAAVVLWRVFGPKGVAGSHKERLAEQLGVADAFGDGPHFQMLDDFLRLKFRQNKEAISKLREGALSEVTVAPWTNLDQPEIHAWLSANHESLAAIAEAVKRPRYYSPMLSYEHGYLQTVPLPLEERLRDAMRALAARAMLRLDAGAHQAAWDDLLALRRMARLLAQGPTSTHWLLAVRCERFSLEGAAVVASDPSLPLKIADRCQAELAEFRPLPPLAEKVNDFERYMALDTLRLIIRKGPEALNIDEKSASLLKQLLEDPEVEDAEPPGPDWSECARMLNRRFDQFNEALRNHEAGRWRAVHDIQLTIDLNHHFVLEGKLNALPRIEPPRTGQIGILLEGVLLPDVRALCAAELDPIARQRLTQTAFALARFHRAHAKFPARLQDLAPEFLTTIPADPFSGTFISYRCDGKEWRLWSVGRNRKDDDGNASSKAAPDADDVVVTNSKT